MPRFPRREYSALASLGLGLALLLASPSASAQSITRFVIPTPDSAPTAITAGPDGALWFAESQGHKIGRIATDGTITEFPLPESAANPLGITAGPGGFLWYTSGGTLGRISTSGDVTTFPISEFDSFGQIIQGPDGNFWCTSYPFRIARITPAGDHANFYGVDAGPGGSSNPQPVSITAGADGNVWYTAGTAVGRITPSGDVRAFPLAPPRTGATAITKGPDGLIWFSAPYGLFRLTLSEDGHQYEMKLFAAHPGASLASGPDGQLWFSGGGRMTLEGAVTDVSIPEGNPGSLALTAGPDGNMWFADLTGNQIGRVSLHSAACNSDGQTMCLLNGRFAVSAGWQATPQGPVAPASVVALSDESGYFWFLEKGNVEIVVKMLNACTDPWNAYWFFASGLTNLGTTVTVKDTLTGTQRLYTNPPGRTFQPILDTSALKTCP
jgi:virginiamycin B lyase